MTWGFILTTYFVNRIPANGSSPYAFQPKIIKIRMGINHNVIITLTEASSFNVHATKTILRSVFQTDCACFGVSPGLH